MMNYKKVLVDALLERDGFNCQLCHEPLGDSKHASLDHKIPRSLNGPDSLSNLQLTHFICNCQKGNRVGFNSQNKELAISLFRDGMKVDEIAKRINRCVRTVYRYLPGYN